MKVEELRALKTEELHLKVKDLKQELFTLRFQQATGQLENPNVLKTKRKNIARILTVIKEREIKEKGGK